MGMAGQRPGIILIPSKADEDSGEREMGYLILGSGGLGTALAHELSARGEELVLVPCLNDQELWARALAKLCERTPAAI